MTAAEAAQAPLPTRAFAGRIQLFSLELRRILQYRSDFWINFSVTVIMQLAMAYFLWRSIYPEDPRATIGGYTFYAMVLYYYLVNLVQQMLHGRELNIISDEIYKGTFTRYLVYPVEVFSYLYTVFLAQSAFELFKLLLGVVIFLFLFPIEPASALTVQSLLQGIISCFAGGWVYFNLSMIAGMVAFWAESAWALIVMLRFSAALLGGGMIPLALFPAWAQPILGYLPFASYISFPARSFMGMISFREWLLGLAVAIIWGVILNFLAQKIMNRGRYRFTGAGM